MDTDEQNLTSSCYAEFVLATCKSAELGEWYTTTGGFMSFLHNQQNISQHYNFVGASSHYTPLHANSSSPPLSNGGSSVLLATPTPPPLTGNQDNVNVDSDDDNGVVRIKLKLNWIQVEDVRLMSAWLNNSMDPINGNDKKAEKYWGDYDKRRIDNSQLPLYIAEGRFQRINQHPNAGSHTFSVGITEDLNTNLLIELRADDIEYVYQRSPAKIVDIGVSTIQALSQVGMANVTTKNIGKLESSYSLTFKCSSGISPVEEQLYTMKPDEVIVRSFELRSSTDQASMHQCEAILKASDFSELDREGYRFSTTATVYNNGAQIGSTNDRNKGGFWESIKALWRNMMDFLTGRLCWTKCPSLFDFGCHIQYVCIGWVLLLLLIPVAAVVVWLLHQEGLFDPLYDWWDGLWSQEPHDDRARRRHKIGRRRRHHHHYNHRHHHGHGDHLHRHHHGTHAHHHPPPAWDVEGQHRHRRHHDGVVLGMQQQYNHRGHGEAVAAAPLRLDGPSRPRVVEDAVEFRERRRSHERDVGHGHRDRDRHGHYFQSV